MDLQIGQKVWYCLHNSFVESEVKSISKVKQIITLTNDKKFKPSTYHNDRFISYDEGRWFSQLLDTLEKVEELKEQKRIEKINSDKEYIKKCLSREFCNEPHWLHPDDCNQIVELIYELKQKRENNN